MMNTIKGSTMKTRQQLQAEGNPGKRPLPPAAEKPDPSLADTKPPDGLDKVARAKWRELLPELVKHGLIRKRDLDTLALYCEAYSNWLRFVKALSGDIDKCLHKTQAGYTQQSAAWTMKCQAAKEMQTLGDRLGLNPASRVNQSARADSAKKEGDEFFTRRIKR